MKKILLVGFVSLFSFAAFSQPITDTSTLRTYINAEIVTNGTKAITAVKLNRILNGYLNCWPQVGSGFFIKNGTSLQTANFNISGDGQIGGALKWGTSSSFPALYRSGDTVRIRLGDNSSYGNLNTGGLFVQNLPYSTTGYKLVTYNPTTKRLEKVDSATIIPPLKAVLARGNDADAQDIINLRDLDMTGELNNPVIHTDGDGLRIENSKPIYSADGVVRLKGDELVYHNSSDNTRFDILQDGETTVLNSIGPTFHVDNDGSLTSATKTSGASLATRFSIGGSADYVDAVLDAIAKFSVTARDSIPLNAPEIDMNGFEANSEGFLSDANSTISKQVTFLNTITADRTLTLPTVKAGTILYIRAANSSGGTFHWSFLVSVFNPDGTTFTQLATSTFYTIVYSGSQWYLIHKQS